MNEQQMYSDGRKLITIICNIYRDDVDMNQDEIFSAANAGLGDAMQNFEAKNGASFATFANRCIRNHVYDCIRKLRAKKRNIELVSVDNEVHNYNPERIYEIKETLEQMNACCIDNLDTTVLHEWMLENRTTARKIAEDFGVAHTTVVRRAQALRKRIKEKL